jgi:hypothetical protein
MENWYVIAIPKIDPPATLVLDPGYGFSLNLLMETNLPRANKKAPLTGRERRICWQESLWLYGTASAVPYSTRADKGFSP